MVVLSLVELVSLGVLLPVVDFLLVELSAELALQLVLPLKVKMVI